MSTFTIKTGDTKPLQVKLERSDGTAIDLGLVPQQSVVMLEMLDAATMEAVTINGSVDVLQTDQDDVSAIQFSGTKWTPSIVPGAYIANPAQWALLEAQPVLYEFDAFADGVRYRTAVLSADPAAIFTAESLHLPGGADPQESIWGLPPAGSVQAKGTVSYRWRSGETDTTGLYYLAWRITDAAGEVETVPSEGYFSLRIE